MKLSTFFIAASLLSSFSVQASDYSYICKQRTDRTPVDAKTGLIGVTVTHLETLATATDYRGEYVDSIDKVKVDVVTTKKGKTTKVKSVSAIATSEDVQFNIKDNGISFHLYMDELDEAGITLKLNGKQTKISLACDFPPAIKALSQKSSLIVKDEGRMISVAWLIKEGIDVQTEYGYENFCYTGDTYSVANQIKAWNKDGVFFSGGGGGFELKKVEVIRGIVTYDIKLILEDEVVPGEFRTALVKPCK